MGKRVKVIGYSYGQGTTVDGLETSYKPVKIDVSRIKPKRRINREWVPLK